MKTILLITLILITGCASIQPKYSDELISSGELAEIQGTDYGYFESLSKMRAWIYKVYDTAGEVIVDRKGGSAIKNISLVEGSYVFVVECVLGSGAGYPRFKYTLEQSKKYKIYCEKGPEGEGLFGAFRKTVTAGIKEIK